MADADDITAFCCNACGLNLPESAFYRSQRRRCKSCIKAAFAKRMSDPAEARRIRAAAARRQTSFRKRRPDRIREILSDFRSRNRESVLSASRERHRQWRTQNPERSAACMRKNSARWRADNRDLAGERAEASRQKKLPQYLERQRLWAQSNPEKAKAKDDRRRASKRKAHPVWANNFVIDEIYRLCVERSTLLSGGVDWSVDHIVPLQSKLVCGLHVHENLQVIPTKLNQSKGNRFWPDMP